MELYISGTIIGLNYYRSEVETLHVSRAWRTVEPILFSSLKCHS